MNALFAKILFFRCFYCSSTGFDCVYVMESGSLVIAIQTWIYNAWNCRPRLIEACFFMWY
jgi:hypothetical protein